MALIITVIVSLRIAGLVIRPLNDIISVSKEIPTATIPGESS